MTQKNANRLGPVKVSGIPCYRTFMDQRFPIVLNVIPTVGEFGPGHEPRAMLEPEQAEPGEVLLVVFDDKIIVTVALGTLECTGHDAMTAAFDFVAGYFDVLKKLVYVYDEGGNYIRHDGYQR